MHFSRQAFRKAVLAHGPIQQPKDIHGMNPKKFVSKSLPYLSIN